MNQKGNSEEHSTADLDLHCLTMGYQLYWSEGLNISSDNLLSLLGFINGNIV